MFGPLAFRPQFIEFSIWLKACNDFQQVSESKLGQASPKRRRERFGLAVNELDLGIGQSSLHALIPGTKSPFQISDQWLRTLRSSGTDNTPCIKTPFIYLSVGVDQFPSVSRTSSMAVRVARKYACTVRLSSTSGVSQFKTIAKYTHRSGKYIPPAMQRAWAPGESK